MGLCTSKQNMKSKERNCILKLRNLATPQSEFGIIIMGYIRQVTKLTLSSDATHAIKTLCTMYYGFIYGDLRVADDQTLKLKHINNIYFVYNSITLQKNAKLTVNRWNNKRANGGLLNIVCHGDIVLHESASINLNGRGYNGGNHARNGESYDIRSPQIKSPHNNYGGGGGAQMSISTFGVHNTAGGGGGYGDNGCDGEYLNYCETDESHKYNSNSQHGVGGCAYGDPQITVLHRGSGGGSGYHFRSSDNSLRANQGGSGGGALKITCFGRIIMKEGSKICCNGNEGSGIMAGGGSGGSIHIVVKNKECLQMNGNSKIEAIGGTTRSCSGNGGNGRIRIEYLSSSPSNSVSHHVNSFMEIIEPMPYIY